MEIKYGGKLQIGDFIVISNGNHVDFGWYCGNGRGTLQYYHYGVPGHRYEDYNEFIKNPDKLFYSKKVFEKGFTISCLWKSYIRSIHSTRVVKLTHPEQIFTELEDIERYEKSKEVLIKLNFIKQ